MNEKTYESVIGDLKGSSAHYETMRGHFEQFCAQIKRLAEEQASPVKGILRAKMDGGAILVEFLDRRIRISARYDREIKGGVLLAEDESAVLSERAPETFERVPFNETGETDLGGGLYGGKLNVGVPADCMTLALRLVDAALDRNPWI
jgi:hypothetical protein